MKSYITDKNYKILIFLTVFYSLSLTNHNVYGLQFKSANRAEPISKTTTTSLDAVRLEENIPHSRKKRSIIFPTGSDLTFDVGISIPISALSATSKLFYFLLIF